MLCRIFAVWLDGDAHVCIMIYVGRSCFDTNRCFNVFCVPGFNVETVEYKNISFTVWDVGGQDKVRFIGA